MKRTSDRIPKWIYQRNAHLAQNYYECLKDGKTNPASARKAAAVQSALTAMRDDDERNFIRQNLFNHVRMQYIDLPMSRRTMNRIRHRFICLLAEEVGDT